MKSLAIINDRIQESLPVESTGTANISGTNITCGIVDVPRPHFDAKQEYNKDHVLVEVTAFSCNYRDKGLIIKSAKKMGGDFRENSFPLSFFGSDFVGKVRMRGKGVENLQTGDRVIPDCSYPFEPAKNIPAGVVTNEASKKWLRLHKTRLKKIPNSMPDEIAAGYSIGGQTSSSMIRRTGVKKGDKILVTSARSHTSLFIIRKLLAMGIIPDVLTTSDWDSKEIDYISPSKMFKIERGTTNWNNIVEKYDVIFDPFFDLHINKAVDHMNYYGRYITCGFKNQHTDFQEKTDQNGIDLKKILLQSTIYNLSIMGNCIGTKEDLDNSIKFFETDKQPIPVQKVMNIHEGKDFLDLTYNLNKFGKVILKYDD